MKYLKTFLIAALMLPLVASAVPEVPVYSTGGTDVSTTLCYAVISANGKNQGNPVITYLNATSDKSASIVQFYKAGTPTAANYVSTSTSIPVVATNGFASTDVIIIRHLADDTYERRVLTTFTSSTNLTVTSAPTTALAVGDLVYKATAAGTIPCGATTVSLSGAGIYSGQAGKPLLLEVDGTSACQVNAVSAAYVK
jgi:hypothetical protein